MNWRRAARRRARNVRSYHASISPEAATPLKDGEVRLAVDLLEDRLGLHGHAHLATTAIYAYVSGQEEAAFARQFWRPGLGVPSAQVQNRTSEA